MELKREREREREKEGLKVFYKSFQPPEARAVWTRNAF